jgi:hypothetical protein
MNAVTSIENFETHQTTTRVRQDNHEMILSRDLMGEKLTKYRGIVESYPSCAGRLMPKPVMATIYKGKVNYLM